MISDVYFPRVNGVSTSSATFRKTLKQLGHSSTLIAPAYGHHQEEDDILRVSSVICSWTPKTVTVTDALHGTLVLTPSNQSPGCSDCTFQSHEGGLDQLRCAGSHVNLSHRPTDWRTRINAGRSFARSLRMSFPPEPIAMSRVLYVLAVTTGSLGVAALTVSLLFNSGTLLLHAGLIALLVSALLLIAVVLTAHRSQRRHTL
jgi:hypothetical protein